MTQSSNCCGEHGTAHDAVQSVNAMRDLVVDCFAATHGPRFGETRAVLGLDSTPRGVRSSIEGMVRLAFQLVGGSFDAPTVDTLAKVVNVLSERSLEWGVPADTIFEHHCSMMRRLGVLAMTLSRSRALAEHSH